MKVNPNKKIRLNNLPTPLSSFVGRERERAEVRQLLSAHRLVTLTGAGGSGKTRLSLKIAEELVQELEDGIWFAELASIFDPALVPQAIASALNIREQSGRAILDILVDYLSTRHVLLVLDNCEHLISACAQLAELLLQRSPRLKILATSREVLGITGEAAWVVPPLSLPIQHPWKDPASATDALKLYENSESVQLFVARAQTISPEFCLTSENGAWVAEICRHLDGMPLAIELAAARVRSLSVQQVAQRLDDRFHLLTGGSRTAPPRQQTLAATLDWSYTLLSATEQKVLQRLSVFAGGATLDAAQSVCAGNGVEPNEVLDLLSHLVEKSLVTVSKPERGETRYRLLETIRQYSQEKLTESGQVVVVKNLHRDYFVQWAETSEFHLDSVEQLPWLESYEVEHDNLRAALEWCKSSGSPAEVGLRLVVACSHFWRLRGYLSEGRTHISAALSRAPSLQKTAMYARALYWEAALAYLQSDYPATRLLCTQSLAIWHELGFEQRSELAETLDLLGELSTEEGDYEKAPVLFKEALEIFRELEDPRGIGDMLVQLAWAFMRMGRYDQVAPLMEEALLIFRGIGDVSHIGFTLSGLGELAIRQGEFERAADFLSESLAIRKQHGHKWGMGASLGSLGWIALRQHDFKRMRAILEESIGIRVEIGDKGGLAWCLDKLAEAKYEESQLQGAARIFGHAESLRVPIRSVIDPADQPGYMRLVSEIRSVLGEETFAALWAEGAAMPLDRVIDLALSEPEPARVAAWVDKERFGGLTAREREVAALIAQGKSNREIAEAMTVGVKTIETYVTRILNKLDFASRVQIATWAIEKKLHPVDH